MPDIHFPRNSVSGNSLKNSLITGTLLLTLAGVLTRIIGFFYRIFLSRLIGAEGLGIYQLLSPVMALGFAVTAAGIQTAISRFVSSELAQNNPAGARLYFRPAAVAVFICRDRLCNLEIRRLYRCFHARGCAVHPAP